MAYDSLAELEFDVHISSVPSRFARESAPIIFVDPNMKLETLHMNISGLRGHKMESKGCLEVRKSRGMQLSYSPDLSGNFNFIDNITSKTQNKNSP